MRECGRPSLTWGTCEDHHLGSNCLRLMAAGCWLATAPPMHPAPLVKFADSQSSPGTDTFLIKMETTRKLF